MATRAWACRLVFVLLCLPLLGGSAQAEPRTDVVTLRNGDHITGEIVSLDRGRLEFKTDDAGTISFEWDKIVAVTAARLFEVGTADGRFFLGSLRAGDPRVLVVVPLGDPIPLPMPEVTTIRPIGTSFWKKLDGSVDLGFSYTRSSEIAQLNLNAGLVYRRPAFEARGTLSGTITQSGEDDQRDDRASLQAAYLRYRGRRWYMGGALGFETNESLGLRLRSQLAFAAGQRLVNSNRAQLMIGGGLAVNQERNIESGTSENVEAILTLRQSYYRYDTPKTNVDVSIQYYPSLSDPGRHRVQFDAAFKREIWKDVFLALTLYDTYDSRPPSADVNTNDIGVVFSFGLSF